MAQELVGREQELAHAFVGTLETGPGTLVLALVAGGGPHSREGANDVRS